MMFAWRIISAFDELWKDHKSLKSPSSSKSTVARTKNFLQLGVPAGEPRDSGLQGVFRSVFQ